MIYSRPAIPAHQTKYESYHMSTPRASADLNEPLLAGASRNAITFHYDIGREIYSLILDPLLVYSAACWKQNGVLAASLEEAQLNKLNYHLDAAGVEQGSRLLDIGCGWGGLIQTASRHRGIGHATGLTLSQDQYNFVKDLALPGTDVHLTSYEDFQAERPYDAVISIGAFEHFVRPGMSQAQRIEIYGNFFRQVARWLVPGGRFSLQTIYWADIDRQYADEIVPTEVFPESDLPFLSEVFEASRTSFEPIAMTTGADDYTRTLMEWLKRLKACRPAIEGLAPDREVFGFFEDYFRTSIVGFRKRRIGLCRVAFRRLDRVKAV